MEDETKKMEKKWYKEREGKDEKMERDEERRQKRRKK